jgi:hypothetical protein
MSLPAGIMGVLELRSAIIILSIVCVCVCVCVCV